MRTGSLANRASTAGLPSELSAFASRHRTPSHSESPSLARLRSCWLAFAVGPLARRSAVEHRAASTLPLNRPAFVLPGSRRPLWPALSRRPPLALFRLITDFSELARSFSTVAVGVRSVTRVPDRLAVTAPPPVIYFHKQIEANI